VRGADCHALAADKTYSLTVRTSRIREAAQCHRRRHRGETHVLGGLIGHWNWTTPAANGRRLLARRRTTGNWSTSMPKKAWVAGEVGGAMEFDGENGYVESPTHPRCRRSRRAASRSPRGSSRPTRRPARATRATVHTGVAKKGYHEGIIYNHEGQFVLCQWLNGEVGAGATSAGTFSRGSSTTSRLWWTKPRAKRASTSTANSTAAARSTRKLRARVRRRAVAHGTAKQQHARRLCLAGERRHDDVRIYNRALAKKRSQTLGR